MRRVHYLALIYTFRLVIVGMVAKKTRSSSKDSSKASSNGIRKASMSKSKLKAQSKSTKSKIHKLNANTSDIDDIRSTLSSITNVREIKALDVKELKSDLKKDVETREKNKKAEQELALQLELIDSMGLK